MSSLKCSEPVSYTHLDVYKRQISQYDYDVKALKKTLDNLDGKSGGFFSNLWSSIKGFFGGDSSGGGIINNTDDAALGNDAIIDSTLDAVKSKANDAVNQAKDEGLWDKIVGFFKDLFGGDDTENSDNTCLLYTSSSGTTL